MQACGLLIPALPHELSQPRLALLQRHFTLTRVRDELPLFQVTAPATPRADDTLAPCPRLHPPALKPLAAALYERAVAFGAVFRQIVVAQFWIAAFNALLTAVFLLVLLPLWDAHLPYRPALITFTFLAGLIPIVGNLMCNLVLTLVGLSVSPTVALACLVFLVVIHKGEYFINAKVIGHRMRFGVWELLAVMFTMEAVFGPAGLVAAPLFYAYLKQELGARGWV